MVIGMVIYGRLSSMFLKQSLPFPPSAVQETEACLRILNKRERQERSPA